MKTEESIFFIDKTILKYQLLSKKYKRNINLMIALSLGLFIIEQLYNAGEIIGDFLYKITQ